MNFTSLVDLRATSGQVNQKTQIQDSSGLNNFTNSPPVTTYGGTLTQSGALAPGGLSPADGDAADVAVQIAAGTPVVTPVANPDRYSVRRTPGRRRTR